ncbi:Transcriptional activator spt7 [Puccinia graminis f. sp. tritici]|uniref:Transcriptional activator spt7 n=1 Tax=Puccinia graminis f. sp. tritici TaxID=56615 RepID=A0A5B0RCC7_PUCGR|nr:Transcriptional activator spt7 [Puccinia graminis f. sp. tritici]KAA1122898.1 Transcriptional activator spt7 [Puccinia graminis f. sp. tritici]
MKFLLELIQSQSHDASELVALSTDARESGLRDEKATIHEFIDTLERITNELRSDPNATAFLSRVRKTDAADYYDVIKKPMDLGTVLKKVKGGVYKTKSAFNDDLELIWTNCFTYNENRNHHLRAAAESLRKKAQDLLKFVSEPSITRPTPNGTAQHASRAGTAAPTPSSPSTTPNLPLLGLKLAEERWRKTERGRATVTEETPIETDNPPVSPTREQNTPVVPQTSCPIPTSQSELRLEQRKALVRDPERMWNWFEGREDEPFEIVEADSLMTGLPALPFASRSTPKPRERKKDKRKEQQQSAAEEGLKKPISANINTLWEIKKVYRKLSNLLMGNPLRGEIGSDQILEEDERVKPLGSEDNGTDDDEEEEEAQPGKLFKNLPSAEVYETCLANSAAQNAMLQIITMMIAHVGFDASHTGALHCLTEIAIQYLCNIGRTLHFFADRFSPVLSASEMIYQTLRANGVGGLDELESYVKDDVDKYGNKLNDLLRKLQAGYGNGLAGTAAKVIGDDDFFSRDGEALMTGEFTTELGEDFFGLRDIGLDSELGLSSLRIPSRLFHGRPKPDADRASEQKIEDQPKPEPRFVKPPEFIPLKPEWIEEQIGLLQPIYKARLETKEFKLKDDDQVTRLPKIIRPKVPPSGKIPIKRRTAPVSLSTINNNNHSEPPQTANKKVKLDPTPQLLSNPQKLSNNSSSIEPPKNNGINEDVVMK